MICFVICSDLSVSRHGCAKKERNVQIACGREQADAMGAVKHVPIRQSWPDFAFKEGPDERLSVPSLLGWDLLERTSFDMTGASGRWSRRACCTH